MSRLGGRTRRRTPSLCEATRPAQNSVLAEMDHVGNKAFLTEALEYLEASVASGCFRLSPTAKLKEHKGPPIAASNLKVGEGGHFKKYEATEDAKAWISEALREMFTYHRENFDRQLFRPIGLCIGDILAKVATLLGGDDVTVPEVMSEAELRFAIADPTLEMICNCWGYQVTPGTCM